MAVTFAMVFSLNFAASAETTTNYDGQIVKMEGLSTLYYVADGKRYVFSNEKTYNTWFNDFDGVLTLTPEQIYALPLAGNILYRPGIVLVKITTDPKVYAVSAKGTLRWVKTEAMAKKLYGDDWNKLIDDIPDSFFTNYNVGAAIENDDDYDADEEADANDTIEQSHGLKLGHAKKSNTAKCRAIPAVPAQPGKKNGQTIPATPAVSARECKAYAGSDDKTAPIISSVNAAGIASTSATVTWTTDEDSDSKVFYSTGSLSDASSTILSVSDSAKVKSHSVNLTGLTATTTYNYYVKSADAAGNTATSSESAFNTTE